jgi:hypothetical protein
MKNVMDSSVNTQRKTLLKFSKVTDDFKIQVFRSNPTSFALFLTLFYLSQILGAALSLLLILRGIRIMTVFIMIVIQIMRVLHRTQFIGRDSRRQHQDLVAKKNFTHYFVGGHYKQEYTSTVYICDYIIQV